jgi:hypothetical protein
MWFTNMKVLHFVVQHWLAPYCLMKKNCSALVTVQSSGIWYVSTWFMGVLDNAQESAGKNPVFDSAALPGRNVLLTFVFLCHHHD